MKRKTIICAALTVSLSAFLLAGCKPATTVTSEVQSEPVVSVVTSELPETGSEGIEMIDRAGNTIVVPEECNRIVSMAPSVTEILLDLGLRDKIVACDTYSGYSAFASDLPEGIPQFDMMAPDNEQIIALNPDIVITTGMSYAGGEDVYSAVKASGVCVADIPSSASIADIKEDLRFLGTALNVSDEVEKIISDMDVAEAEIKSLSDGITEKKTVLYIMSVPTPDYPDVYTCGKGTYMDEIFTLTGLKNIAGDIEYEWPAMSEEDIIAANPDVIIVGDTYTPDAVDAVLALDGWGGITAIKNKAVYSIDGDAFNQPNQYVMNSAYEIATSVYPEVYADMVKPF